MTDIPSKAPITDPMSSGARTRRDFLYIATAAMGTVGVAASIVPMIAQLEPDKATLAAGGPVELDLTQVQAGQQVVVHWRGHPIFVVNRPAAALKMLQNPKLVERLSDPQSKEFQQPQYAQNWHRSAKPEYGVFVGICTHLGCIPLYYPNPSASAPVSDWLGGYFCPCHGSKYDLAGRVFSGVPAPYNLPVPPYRFVNDHKIRIGENPPDSHFSFESIRQI
ncbi:MAG: Ubiquinol-cytochrome c reductase, iron-sulfur subunit [Nitrobacter sp.]|uniref:ubiquinol-cytochrome c reductase iron-sulfur subunit n=1 Tax=Nitrobacter sp. TaxID=29420 RepID=UPI00387E0114